MMEPTQSHEFFNTGSKASPTETIQDTIISSGGRMKKIRYSQFGLGDVHERSIYNFTPYARVLYGPLLSKKYAASVK